MTGILQGEGCLHKLSATDDQKDRARAFLEAFVAELRPYTRNEEEARVNGAAAAVACIVRAATETPWNPAGAITILAAGAANCFAGLPQGDPLTAAAFAMIAQDALRFHGLSANVRGAN